MLAFLAGIAHGAEENDWQKALKKHYGFQDIRSFETAWQASLNTAAETAEDTVREDTAREDTAR